ncbi:MAG: HDOD domain-containing protein [Planctomycetes bacterium]|nr:HDOD domain-containing protein [Planctomycetota bacterium]
MLDLSQLIDRTVSIPAVPQVLLRLQEIVNDPNKSILDAVQILEEDPGLGVRCLRIANSAVYGIRTPVATLRHAGSVLGMRKIHELALQSCLVGQFDHLRKLRAFNIDLFWQHSAVTVVTSRELAKVVKGFRSIGAERAAACGLLHNIGRLAMLDHFRAGYLDVVLPAGGHGDDACKAESEAFGFDHAAVGSLLASKWNLSPETVEVTRDHHRPFNERSPLTALVGFASYAAYELLNSGDYALKASLNSQEAAFLGLTTEEVDEVSEIIVENSVSAFVA